MPKALIQHSPAWNAG